MLFRDAATIASPRRTRDGYLVATIRAARIGIQAYAGHEVGRPDLDRVAVFRPESEVFARDALRSLVGIPITLGHPDTVVDANNWRTLAVGNVGATIGRDGDFVTADVAITDATTIREIEAGTRELSIGYACDLTWGTGFLSSGERHDAMQRQIRANHLAIVDRARGGASLRLGA